MKQQVFNKNEEKLYEINDVFMHLYAEGRSAVRRLFKELTPLEYEILLLIEEEESRYLSDVADQAGVSLWHVSRASRLLSERHFALWRHDGDGEGGTYLQITKDGQKALMAQKKALQRFYEYLLSVQGEENVMGALKQLKTLTEAMKRAKAERSDDI